MQIDGSVEKTFISILCQADGDTVGAKLQISVSFIEGVLLLYKCAQKPMLEIPAFSSIYTFPYSNICGIGNKKQKGKACSEILMLSNKYINSATI